jgi:hypothetical protein
MREYYKGKVPETNYNQPCSRIKEEKRGEDKKNLNKRQ